MQYVITSLGPSECHLRVTFKLVFGMRALAMKALLTGMIRGEHENAFTSWLSHLLQFLASSKLPTSEDATAAAAAGGCVSHALRMHIRMYMRLSGHVFERAGMP